MIRADSILEIAGDVLVLLIAMSIMTAFPATCVDRSRKLHLLLYNCATFKYIYCFYSLILKPLFSCFWLRYVIPNIHLPFAILYMASVSLFFFHMSVDPSQCLMLIAIRKFVAVACRQANFCLVQIYLATSLFSF